MGKASIENVMVIRDFLLNLELISGLKINKEKCCLYTLNVEDGRAIEIAEILECMRGSIPFKYLGVTVGRVHRKASEWNYIIQKIQNRLRKLSIGGRLTLLNMVLSSLPVYFLSIYHVPKKVQRKIIKLQRNFFWGGG